MHQHNGVFQLFTSFMTTSLLATTETTELLTGINPDGGAIRPVRIKPIQYFLEANGAIKEMDTNNYQPCLGGQIIGVNLWLNRKDEAYMGIACKTSQSTGWQLNLKCNNLQYCARQAVAKIACLDRLSMKDTAVKMTTEQLPGRKVGGKTLKAIAFEVFVDDNPIADERLCCDKDPVAFMDAFNFLRTELGLMPFDRQWLAKTLETQDSSLTPLVDVDSESC